MSELARFGVAMEKSLLQRFDDLGETRGYANRSEALRDLVRRELARMRGARAAKRWRPSRLSMTTTSAS